MMIFTKCLFGAALLYLYRPSLSTATQTHGYCQINDSEECKKGRYSALRPSLFSNIPPYVYFAPHNATKATKSSVPKELKPYFVWRVDGYCNDLIKTILKNSGIRMISMKESEHEYWIGSWTGIKDENYVNFKPTQIAHHLPALAWRDYNTKDNLWLNFKDMQTKFPDPIHGFDYLPKSWVTPTDRDVIKKIFEEKGENARFLIKDPAKERGEGIVMATKYEDIKDLYRRRVVQEYITNCHLINGKKYDLRIWFFIKSVDPLRVYIHPEGIVRFAAKPFSLEKKDFHDFAIHICNTAVQEKVGNLSKDEDRKHRWSLSQLIEYYATQGVKWEPIWEKIKDITLKTLISGEPRLKRMLHKMFPTHYIAGDLIGMDIVIDNDFRPWLLEFNMVPSMRCPTKMDKMIRGPMSQEVMNLGGVQVPCNMDGLKQRHVLRRMFGLEANRIGRLCMDPKFYSLNLTDGEMQKHEAFERQKGPLQHDQILADLTKDDVKQLIRYEDELAVQRTFHKIFPTKDSEKYLKYFWSNRYYNLLFIAWEVRYSEDRAAGQQRLESLWKKYIANEDFNDTDEL